MTESCDPADVPRTAIEQRVIDAHTEWMRDNAHGLRLLDSAIGITPDILANEELRTKMLSDLSLQIAVDAFKLGLAVIALAEPQYFVQNHVSAWMDSNKPIPSERAGWLPAPPPANMIEPNARILIKIEAYGFPIGPREV